ncbi:DUF2339 domain-containing protein [Coraliomargarita sp. W4R53]
MIELLGLLFALGLIATLILPWVNWARISGQGSELERLKRELCELQKKQAASPQAEVVPAEKSEPAARATQESCDPGTANLRASEPAVRATQESCDPGNANLRIRPASESADRAALRVSPELSPSESKSSAEPAAPVEAQDWFSKIAVWVGGIALLMAGFYMIKYSIDSGLLTPVVRLCLTAGFGVLLCVAGFVIGIKSSLVANERIGQALSGAGIACLYFAAYAAVHLYGFLSSGQGFAVMLMVTVLAVVLSLKNGAPIAMLGLVGGFLTPWLMSGGLEDTVMLFGYLFLLFCGAQFLCVRRGWWGLMLGSLLGAYLWSVVVVCGSFTGGRGDLEGTLIFVLGICLVNVVWAFFAKQRELSANAARLVAAIRLLTWGGGLVQGLILVLIGGFAAVDMALFSLLSVGALLLAVLKEDDFIWAAWLALAAVAASVLSNGDVALWSWLLIPLGLMGLFFVVGHWRGLASGRALTWRSLSLASGLLVVPLLYLNREWAVGLDTGLSESLWLWMALGWAGLLALAGEHLLRREDDRVVAGEYSAFAIFLISFGLWTYVSVDSLASVLAGLLVVSALYWRSRQFGRSISLTSVLAGAWGLLMVYHVADACAYFFREDLYSAPEQDGLAVIAWGMGLVAAAVVYGCFRNVWAGQARRIAAWWVGLVGLLGFVATYQWVDQSYLSSEWQSVTVEGCLTALLAVIAVCLRSAARKWEGLHVGSALIAGLVGLRIAMLHLGDAGAAGESFFVNALLLQFGVPFVAVSALAWLSGPCGDERLRRIYQVAAMLLGFVWASFLVQDYYGGSQLLGGNNSSAEIYTYSVVWLLLAVIYQAVGLWRSQPAIHVGSLILLLVTIGKVFLVDAAALEGLFRVLSFLGLGLSLLGIGFFYNKVIFARQRVVSTQNE